MRRIDADALHEEISKWPESVMYKDWVQSAIANAPTIAPPPNDPLTLEELREMDGEPVYDWMGYEWFVVSEVTDDEVIMTDGTIFDIDEDSPNSSDQRFYRRKPEEGTT